MSDELCCGYSDKGHMKWCDEGRDRHPKWQRVETGTVIPAGQPYMIEYTDPVGGCVRAEYVQPDRDTTAGHPYFIDSSWKPPLVLPTEPTWGIVLTQRIAEVGRWKQNDDGSIFRTHRDFQNQHDTYSAAVVTDFIPLTDEQVARIEATR